MKDRNKIYLKKRKTISLKNGQFHPDHMKGTHTKSISIFLLLWEFEGSYKQCKFIRKITPKDCCFLH